MKLTASQLETLRQQPQTTKLYLSIFQPVAIFKARVNNASAAKGDRIIAFDTVSLGLYTYIQDGMTMWIGTTDGGMEVGKVRVRSATPTTITVSENSNIAWADNLYLTIFRYWELWPIYPRIIQNPANIEDVIFYKDYDIPYTNQNSILGTYVNAGPHRAAWLDPASGQTQIYYSSTGSYNLLGNTLNYNWFFEGATVTGSSSADPGYITYNTPGHYVTRLSISGSSGGVDTTYRYVSIYNQANPPISKWTLDSLQGSRDEGGYSASIKVFEIIPVQEHAVVVIFGQNEYGSTPANLGGNYPNAGDILFVGYVDKDSISYDYQHSQVSFDATSLTDVMQKSSGFGVSVKSVLSPTKWYELLDMDGRRALYHYLRWHTTALAISDFQFVGNDVPIQFFDSDRESMYDAINNYMQGALVGKVVSDRQGKIWMEIDAAAYPNPTGTFTPAIMNITNRDWMNSPVIEERLTNDVSYMEWGGVAYSGVNTGTFDPVMSEAPGNAPGFYGEVTSLQGLALQNQGQLNQMLGNVFANKNSKFPTIGLDMAINAANLDIAPQETVELHIAREDTVRNVQIDGLYIPDSVTLKYDPKGFSLLPTWDMKSLVNGDPASTVIIPPVADVGGGYTSYAGYDLKLPPFPGYGFFPPTLPGDGAPARVLAHDNVLAGLVYTQTFQNDQPSWYSINGGLTSSQYLKINRVVICPNGAVYVARLGTCDGGTLQPFIARAPYIGGTFTIIQNVASIRAFYGAGADNGCAVHGIGYNPALPECVGYVIGLEDGITDQADAFYGVSNSFTQKAHITNVTGFGSMSFGLNQWMFTSEAWSFGPVGNYRLFTFDLGTQVTSANPWFYLKTVHKRVGNSGTTVHFGDDTNKTLHIGTNNYASSVEVGSLVNNSDENQLDFDPTGKWMMSPWFPTNKGKSSDGGTTWADMPMLPLSNKYCFGYAGGTAENSKWVAGAAYVQYSPDFGNSWKTKQGNLYQLSPLYYLDIIRALL